VSSLTASNSVAPAAALQIAPLGEDGPDFSQLKKAFQDCATNNQSYVTQTAQNYATRFAIWGGQSADGKKHSRGPQGQTEPVPCIH